MTEQEEVVSVVSRVARALEAVDVEYLVGGSVATSLYGEPRATRDVDIAVRLSAEKVAPLVKELEARG